MYASTLGSLGGLSDEARALLVRSAQAEEIASEILWRKQMLIDLDRQRQECMQALATFRERKKVTAAPTTPSSSFSAPAAASVSPSSLRAPPPAKLWVSFQSQFVRLPRDSVAAMLQADRAKLDDEIAAVRAQMKELMQQLQAVQQSIGIPKGLLDFALT